MRIAIAFPSRAIAEKHKNRHRSSFETVCLASESKANQTDRRMVAASAWLAQVDEWERKTKRTITASQVSLHSFSGSSVDGDTSMTSNDTTNLQADFQHEKFSLQLHLESNPVPFRPSTVLAQLINGEQRRGLSTKQQNVRVKNAEHLERKLESEVRQHYELESAQACTKWKQLYLHLMDKHRQLLHQIEHDAKQMSKPIALQVPPFSMDTTLTSQDDVLDEEAEVQRQHLLVESEWIHQERFNIQEAFTNQTKKIQTDYQAFIDQLDAEFITERQKILTLTQPEGSQPAPNNSPVKGGQRVKAAQLNRQFKSNAKRHMLIHTAPVVELHSQDSAQDFLSKRRIGSDKSNSTDMTPTNRQLRELEQRLASFTESAEARLKDGMQWIARQCAHMFTQLDCKEAEAKLVLLLTEQNSHGAHKLLHRVDIIASLLRTSIHEHKTQLPGLPSLQRQPPASRSTSSNASRLAPLTAPSNRAHRHEPRRRSEPVGLNEHIVR